MSDHRIVLGDCLDPVTGLASLGDKSVDHVICDPPYAPRAMKNARSHSGTIRERRDGVVYDFGYAALTPEVRGSVAAEFGRLARRWVIVWCDIESVGDWRADLEASGLRYVRTGIWHRLGSAPQFSSDRPAQGVEACVIAHGADEKLAWNGGGASAVWTVPIVHALAPERVHSTPKPIRLMEAQVRDFTDPGELVCDPFAGSGTTGVACKRLGRRFIGWERDPRYAEIAQKRIDAAHEQYVLGGPKPSRPKQALLGIE